MTKLSRRVSAVLCALVFAGGIAACSSSDSTAGSDTTTAETTVAPAPTAAPTTEAPEPVEATEGAPSSAEAASLLVDAWNEGNREAAARIADPWGVDGIFETPDPEMWLRGCTVDDALPEGGCIYRTASGLVQINTEQRDIGWVVSSAVYDPLADGTETHGDAPEGPQD